MKNIRFAVLAAAIAACALGFLLFRSSAQEITASRNPARFADQIEAFLKADSVNPPPKNAILFIGSSTFRMWTHVNEHMAPLPAFNRAFGGSRTHEVLYYMDKIVFPYQPRMIVYYCGSNDIAGGVSPEVVLSNFTTFCERVKAKLPATKIFFVSIAKTPSRIARWGAMDSANTMIGEYCRSAENISYIELNPILFDAEGKPRMELYRDDKLHFKEPAYIEVAAVIKPVLERAWKNMH